MRGTIALGVWTVVVAGCGSTASPGGPEHTNGTRLKARVFVADGARQLIAWYDTQRDEDCAFARTADGALHCLPVEATYADIFADSGCTQPIMLGSMECGAPSYAWHVATPCDVGYTLHRRGARLDPPPASYYFRNYDGSCVTGGPADPTYDYFALEPAEDLADFVAGDTVRESAGPLDRERLVADDGARYLAGWAIDPASGAYADPWQPAPDAQTRWLPQMHSGGWFADGTCTQELGCKSPPTCPGGTATTLAPLSLSWAYPPSCESPFVIRELGTTAASPEYWRDSMTCYPLDPPPVDGTACFDLGDVVPFDGFPAHTWLDLPGGRIRARYAAVEGGDAILPAWFLFHDTQLGEDCYPLTAIDGSFRCLPSFFIPYADLFADLACTIPAAYWHEPLDKGSCPLTRPIPALVTWREPDVTPCAGGHFSDAPRRTYRVGALLPAAETLDLFVVDYSSGFAECVSFDPATMSGPVHAITEMAPEEFVLVEELVEE